MIQKIKDLMAMNDQIEVIKNNLNYTTNSMNDLKTEIGTLKQQINENISSINDKNNEFFKNFGEDINIIKSLRHDFEKELFDFKLLRSQMQKKIIEKFEEELGKELKIQMDTLKNDSESYNELKENINKVTEKVNILSEEMNKFITISSNIKKEDFELTRFANKVQEADREKLELMSKIDALERLVSKIRRQEFVTR
jgi:chromosome segregation ATPase